MMKMMMIRVVLTKLETVFCLKGTTDRMFTPLAFSEVTYWLPWVGAVGVCGGQRQGGVEQEERGVTFITDGASVA